MQSLPRALVGRGKCLNRDPSAVEKPRSPADIVVYDLEKLEILPSEVAEDLPGGEWRRIQKSKGYDWILVNGQITFEPAFDPSLGHHRLYLGCKRFAEPRYPICGSGAVIMILRTCFRWRPLRERNWPADGELRTERLVTLTSLRHKRRAWRNGLAS